MKEFVIDDGLTYDDAVALKVWREGLRHWAHYSFEVRLSDFHGGERYMIVAAQTASGSAEREPT